jgi:hypothetical protein
MFHVSSSVVTVTRQRGWTTAEIRFRYPVRAKTLYNADSDGKTVMNCRRWTCIFKRASYLWAKFSSSARHGQDIKHSQYNDTRLQQLSNSPTKSVRKERNTKYKKGQQYNLEVRIGYEISCRQEEVIGGVGNSNTQHCTVPYLGIVHWFFSYLWIPFQLHTLLNFHTCTYTYFLFLIASFWLKSTFREVAVFTPAGGRIKTNSVLSIRFAYL